MNQTEAAAIEKNSWFKDRVRNCTSVYANYLLNTGVEDPEYQLKVDAGTRIAREADFVVTTLMFTLSGDIEVQTAGPAIPDPQLQAIVEKTIKKFYPIQPPALFGVPIIGQYVPPPQTN